MRATVCLFVVLAFTHPLSADDAARKKYIEECAARYKEAKSRVAGPAALELDKRKRELLEAHEVLEATEKGEISTGVNYAKKDAKTGKWVVRHSSEKSKAAAVAKAKTTVEDAGKAFADAKAKAESVEPSAASWAMVRTTDFEVGQIGVFSFNGRDPATGKVWRIVDGKNMVVQMGKLDVWVEAPTKGLADGKDFALEGIYEIVGTKKNFGSTYYHFRPSNFTQQELRMIKGE